MCEQCTSTTLLTTGSRRRRLWELPTQSHCPVIGVCLPLPTLRNLINKALSGRAVADDYEIHVGAVAECAQRNRISELLHKELESRYAGTIQAFKVAKTSKAVADLWAEAVRKGEVSGSFWAALTHPRCDEVLQEVLLRDMHMLQHQAGAAVRVDVSKVQALIKENGVLAAELGKVQERFTRAMAEKSADIEQLQTELLQQRAISIGKDTRIACLTQDLNHLKSHLSDYEHTARLHKKVEQLHARLAALEGQNAQLRQQLQEAQRLTEDNRKHVVASEVTALQSTHAAPATVPPALQHKTVLCVGGRNGNLAHYREVIEKAGGRFAHHDGGLKDNQGVLDASLAAADLVICQTGCINHNAYWRVKDFCKRTGTQCVFVENPSRTALTRCLQQIALDDSQGNPDQNSHGNTPTDTALTERKELQHG